MHHRLPSTDLETPWFNKVAARAGSMTNSAEFADIMPALVKLSESAAKDLAATDDDGFRRYLTILKRNRDIISRYRADGQPKPTAEIHTGHFGPSS